MTEDKKVDEKTTKKTTKKSQSTTKKSTISKAKAPRTGIKKIEKKGLAIDIAKKLGISDYEFLVIKRQHNLDDSSLVTVEAISDLYKKTFINK